MVHKVMQQWCFSSIAYSYSLENSMTNWAQIFTELLIYACWDTPSENTGSWQYYETCQVPLKPKLYCPWRVFARVDYGGLPDQPLVDSVSCMRSNITNGSICLCATVDVVYWRGLAVTRAVSAGWIIQIARPSLSRENAQSVGRESLTQSELCTLSLRINKWHIHTLIWCALRVNFFFSETFCLSLTLSCFFIIRRFKKSPFNWIEHLFPNFAHGGIILNQAELVMDVPFSTIQNETG